jgi:hypothetical protein
MGPSVGKWMENEAQGDYCQSHPGFASWLMIFSGQLSTVAVRRDEALAHWTGFSYTLTNFLSC